MGRAAEVADASEDRRAQLVEVRETVQEVAIPVYVKDGSPKPTASTRPLFAQVADEVLLGYGVPAE